MKTPYRKAYSNFPRPGCVSGTRNTFTPSGAGSLTSFLLPRQIRSTVAPSAISASIERRGRGSNGEEEKVTIATRLPASRLRLAATRLPCEVGSIVCVITESVIVGLLAPKSDALPHKSVVARGLNLLSGSFLSSDRSISCASHAQFSHDSSFVWLSIVSNRQTSTRARCSASHSVRR